MVVVGEIEHPTMAHHDVEVELTPEPLPELHGVVVDGGAFVVEIVGADNRRVAPGVAAAEPALVDKRNIAEPVLLGEVIGRCRAMSACADDDGIVALFRHRLMPDGPPARMASEPLPQQRPDGIVRHRFRPRASSSPVRG